MSGQIDQIRAAIDSARGSIQAIGLREYTVTLRTPTWVNANPDADDPGILAYLAPDVIISPWPTVTRLDLNDTRVAGGFLQAGDVEIGKITRLNGMDAIVSAKETVWKISGPGINGDFQSLDGYLTFKSTESIAVVRFKVPVKSGT